MILDAGSEAVRLRRRKSDYWVDGTIPWILPKDMGVSAITDTGDYITEAAVAGSATKIVPEHAVAIMTRSSILDHTLPVAFLNRPAARGDTTSCSSQSRIGSLTRQVIDVLSEFFERFRGLAAGSEESGN
ncbi:restriction endonuclease subunit S domain-containing protein [Devriesea agamarum]|uniref:hypothetical protein n=1 Tax=Devriesea agamarum TaxID=472569 RepID=UPI00071C55E1|nr:hypothetical protein [Devriesea agamarum]